MSGEKIGYDGQDGQINAECYRKTSKNMLTHSFRRPIMDLLGKTKNYVFGVKNLP